MNPRPPRNISRASMPWWSKPDFDGPIADIAPVIIVSRGEPNRDDDQMHTAVLEQVRAWQAKYNPQDPAEVADLAAASIWTTDILPYTAQAVRVTVPSLNWHLKRARKAVES